MFRCLANQLEMDIVQCNQEWESIMSGDVSNDIWNAITRRMSANVINVHGYLYICNWFPRIKLVLLSLWSEGNERKTDHLMVKVSRKGSRINGCSSKHCFPIPGNGMKGRVCGSIDMLLMDILCIRMAWKGRRKGGGDGVSDTLLSFSFKNRICYITFSLSSSSSSSLAVRMSLFFV